MREAARTLGCATSAAPLRRKTSNVVGVVINDLMNPFFAKVRVGLERKLVDVGYIVLMAHTSKDLQRQE